MERWSAPLLRRQSLALSVLAVAIGIALGGFGASAADSAAPQSPANDGGPPPVASATPPTKPDKTAAASAPVGSTLDRILANWKARKEQTRSLYFAWDSRLFSKRASAQRRQGKTPAEPALYSGA